MYLVMFLRSVEFVSQVTLQSSSCSRMNLPSLYFSDASYALSYFHPTVSLHWRQVMSRTTCRPVVMLRSLASPASMFTTVWKRYALPCWPRKFCRSKSSVSEGKTRRHEGADPGI